MSDKALASGASVAVIGAGIIGVATACALASRGYEVVVYDRSAPGEAGASRSNAGHIAASDIFPLSSPGIHWKALGMLLSRDGALKIPARDALAHIPWFWRFCCNSRRKPFEAATRALTYLCRSTLADTAAMFESAGIGDMLRHSGCAFVYDDEQSFNSSKYSWADKRAQGFDSDAMDAARLAKDIPAIAENFRHVVLSQQWSMVSDPLDVVRGLVAAAESNGVVFQHLAVNALSAKPGMVSLDTDHGSIRHEAVIVAAGVNSAGFAKSCGDYLPMAAERGYNLTIPTSGIELDLPLVFADRGVVATQLSSGLRIGGVAEYAHPDRPANENHFKSIARISAELFPGINLDNVVYWMGKRPSLPDSVPVISRSRYAPGVFYNCGHGHYGLTHAATSARLLCELLAGDGDLPAQQAYSIERFR